MNISLLIAVFLLTSTVFMLLVGYMSTKAVLPSRESLEVDEYQRRMIELTQMGQHQAVIDHSTEEIRARPDALAAYLHRADAYRRSGEPDLAIADYTAALERIPSGDVLAQAEILYARGLLWQQTDEHEMAVRDFDDRLAASPGCASTHAARALSLFQLGDLQRAQQDLNISIELNPHEPEAYDLRAQIRRTLGQSDGAELDLLRAKRLREGTADW